jgi:uncharacterized lipoprotein NlpE involved in copper resistance
LKGILTMRKTIFIIMLGIMLSLMGCSSKDNENVDESIQLYDINGRYLFTTTGANLLLSDDGAILLTPIDGNYDVFKDLNNGDKIQVSIDGIRETYPAQASIYGLTLLQKGDVKDLDEEELQNLASLGWYIDETANN